MKHKPSTPEQKRKIKNLMRRIREQQQQPRAWCIDRVFPDFAPGMSTEAYIKRYRYALPMSITPSMRGPAPMLDPAFPEVVCELLDTEAA